MSGPGRVARWFAPGRVNLIGEHTDYNDGFALPLATTAGCVATVTPVAGTSVTVSSAGLAAPVVVDTLDPRIEPPAASRWAQYPLGVLWAMRSRGLLPTGNRGVEIGLDSNVPLGAGLSSSAALICSTAGALAEAFGMQPDPDMLLEVTRAAENDFVGVPSGGLDQLASLRCTPGHALLCDMRDLSTSEVAFSPEEFGLRLLVLDTRAEHGHVDNEYRTRLEQCRRAAAEIGVPALRDATLDQVEGLADDVLRRRARHIVTDDDRVLRTAELLRAGRLAELGPLLSASHASMRDDFEITCPEVDLAAETLESAGALGARMTGGGFGGCVIALIPPEQVEPAAAAVSRAFADAGFTAPAWFTDRAGAGAHSRSARA